MCIMLANEKGGGFVIMSPPPEYVCKKNLTNYTLYIN